MVEAVGGWDCQPRGCLSTGLPAAQQQRVPLLALPAPCPARAPAQQQPPGIQDRWVHLLLGVQQQGQLAPPLPCRHCQALSWLEERRCSHLARMPAGAPRETSCRRCPVEVQRQRQLHCQPLPAAGGWSLAASKGQKKGRSLHCGPGAARCASPPAVAAPCQLLRECPVAATSWLHETGPVQASVPLPAAPATPPSPPHHCLLPRL